MLVFCLLFLLYMWLEFYKHAQFHITTPQRVYRVMHYSPTLRHIPESAVSTPNFAEEVHRGNSGDPHNPEKLAQHY